MDWRLLHNACADGDARTVAILLHAGADPNRIAPTTWWQAPLHRALEFRITHPKHEGHTEVVRLLLGAGADATLRATALDMTPWELACFCGLSSAEQLLRPYQERASPHPEGMTQLWLAAASRLPEETAGYRVRLLLSTGADPNAIWKHATPLMMAAGHAHHHQVADALLEAGANPNIGTSLLHACCDWHLEYLPIAIAYMAHHGWNVNAADQNGETALHKAAFLGNTAAVKELLAVGADPAIRDSQNRLPADVAKHGKKAPVLVVLQQRRSAGK